MSGLPFVNPALLGIGFAAGLAWSFAAPTRLRHPAIAVGVGLGIAALTAALGFIPWTGRLSLAWHGIIMGVGFIAAWGIAHLRTRHLPVPPGFLADQLLIALIGGIVGARLWYVIERWQQFSTGADGSPLPLGTILTHAADIDGGGMVWYGSLLLGGLGMLVHGYRQRVDLVAWADAVAPAVLVGLSIGRIGCFVNGCCYGKPSDLPWAYLHHDWTGRVCTVQPTQLYEAAAALLLATGLWWWSARRQRSTGAVAVAAAIGYGCWRFANEIFRGDTATPFAWSPLHITNAQWTSLGMVAIGITLLLWMRRRDAARPPGPADPPA